MKQKRARLIYNPTSGQEIMKKNVAEVLDILEGAGFEASAFQTTPDENSAKNEATRAAKAGFDLVIAAGGDGTINEVVSGIAPLKNRPQMAVIPTGTTNDFARALKIPRGNPVEAAKVIAKNQTLQMDIGRAYADKYFINIAAAGSFTELTYSVPSRLKTVLGYLAYLVKGAELLPQVRRFLSALRMMRVSLKVVLTIISVNLPSSSLASGAIVSKPPTELVKATKIMERPPSKTPSSCVMRTGTFL